MAIDIRDTQYTTQNTALAAYLRMTGFILLDVEKSNYQHPAVFIFKSTPQILECERQWQMRLAEGNLNNFWESYRLCLRMVKVGKL